MKQADLKKEPGISLLIRMNESTPRCECGQSTQSTFGEVTAEPSTRVGWPKQRRRGGGTLVHEILYTYQILTASFSPSLHYLIQCIAKAIRRICFIDLAKNNLVNSTMYLEFRTIESD